MIKWRALPMFRLLLPYMLGCVMQQNYPDLISMQGVIFLILLVLPACILIHFFYTSYRKRWIFGCSLSLLFFLIGVYRSSQVHREPLEAYASSPQQEWLLQGTVREWKETAKKWRVTLSLSGISQSGHVFSLKGSTLLAYLPKDSSSRALKKGDLILVRGELQRIPPPKNPDAFDLQRYFHYQHIHFQTFTTDWQLLEAGKCGWLERNRQEALRILKNYVVGQSENAVLTAMVLGERKNMEPSVRNLYTNTGAVHVLAVSGLHVGLIYLLIAFLTRKLPERGRWKLLRIGIQLIVIWLYAFFTGASPSVLRAATMFSFVGIGKVLDRRSLIYNTLAASALILVLIDPFLLWQPGFQLSYLAVLGIIFFQPRIADCWHPHNKLILYGWQLSSVSFAAQLTTLPLSLYYFHQFPTYFWLSSLLVIPAAPVIIGGGISVLAFHYLWAEAAFVAGKLLETLIYIINRSLASIEQLPYSLWKNIWISFSEMIALYLLILCLAAFWSSLAWKWVKLALFILIAWSVSSLWREPPEMIVYATNKGMLIDIFTGKNAYTIQKGSLRKKDILWIAGNYRLRKGDEITPFSCGKPTENTFFYYQPPFLQMGNHQFFLVDEKSKPEAITGKLTIDYLLVAGPNKTPLESWEQKIRWKEVWLVNGAAYMLNRKWMKACKRKNITCRQVFKSGAIRILHSHPLPQQSLLPENQKDTY